MNALQLVKATMPQTHRQAALIPSSGHALNFRGAEAPPQTPQTLRQETSPEDHAAQSLARLVRGTLQAEGACGVCALATKGGE